MKKIEIFKLSHQALDVYNRVTVAMHKMGIPPESTSLALLTEMITEIASVPDKATQYSTVMMLLSEIGKIKAGMEQGLTESQKIQCEAVLAESMENAEFEFTDLTGVKLPKFFKFTLDDSTP